MNFNVGQMFLNFAIRSMISPTSANYAASGPGTARATSAIAYGSTEVEFEDVYIEVACTVIGLVLVLGAYSIWC